MVINDFLCQKHRQQSHAQPVVPIDIDKGSMVALELFQRGRVRIAIVTEQNTLQFSERKEPFADRRYTEWNVLPGDQDRAFVYESNDGGNHEIFLGNRSTAFDLSNHRATDINPVWSPNYKWIAFESFRDTHREGLRDQKLLGRSKVPARLKPGQYSIRATTPYGTDINIASVYILPRKPSKLTLNYIVSTESINLTEASDSDLYIFVVPMPDNRVQQNPDMLPPAIPIVRIPQAGQEQNYESIYGALPHSIQIGRFSLILFGVKETKAPECGRLQRLRRNDIAYTWTIGINHRSPINLPVHEQLMLFDDNPFDVILSPLNDGGAKNLQAWKRTRLISLPESGSANIKIELTENTLLVNP